MSESCLFCEIASGARPAEIVHAEEELVAFLDIGPIRPGHVLIVPRHHYPYFEDLPEALALRVMALGQRFARVQKRLYDVGRAAFFFTGGDVPHAHAHVVPLHDNHDVTSRRYIVEEEVHFRMPPPLPPEELARSGAALRGALADLSED